MIYSDPMQTLWNRHQQIIAALAPRIAALSLNHPPVTVHTDPVLMFTHAMAHTMALYMYRLIGEVLPAPDETTQAIVDECARSFNLALVEVVNLTKMLSQMSYFKVRIALHVLNHVSAHRPLQVHPLYPIPLYLCVGNLTTFNEGGGVFDEQLKVIFNALSNLKRINILGQHSQSSNTEDPNLPISTALELPSDLQSMGR